MCSCGRWWVCSSQISSIALCAKTELVLGPALPCKSTGEAWEAGSGALEVSRENTGEVERMKTAMGWVLTTWGKVNLRILEQFRALNPSLEDGPVLLQASLYSIRSLLTRERGEFSSQHLSWQDQLEAERVEKGRGTLNWSSAGLVDDNNLICSFSSEALQRAVSHQQSSLLLWP